MKIHTNNNVADIENKHGQNVTSTVEQFINFHIL